MKYDLHSHSTASDGVLSPTELVQRAVEQGVEMLALTDHDTISGICEAKNLPKHNQSNLSRVSKFRYYGKIKVFIWQL